jgi:starch phosphorylase
MGFEFKFPYTSAEKYNKKCAYLCMEFGVAQPLKIYAGGLGFLAGSHMRSAYSLKQHTIGIGILWKYGYYAQTRKQDQSMDVHFEESRYAFLVPTEIKFTIKVAKKTVWATAYYLPPETFQTAPLFLLTTDLEENDYLAKTISHKLYDANPETKIAAAILLGEGAAKLMEAINWIPEVYHLNESHALPLAFYLYQKSKNIEEVKKRLVYTNHTPEGSGNQVCSIPFLERMSFFCDIPLAEVIAITKVENDNLNLTLAALRLSKKANAVSKLHQKTLCKTWGGENSTCEIISITNAQDFESWSDKPLYEALKNVNHPEMSILKKRYKKELFETVADQCGVLFDENICTVVFAKRFTDYKRPDIFFHDMERFEKMISSEEKKIQLIWAGKPYPMDYSGIGVFDKIVDLCKKHNNCAILTGYELNLSRLLKKGADIWLNMPRLTHEASGTSGMSAAMNGAVNVGIPDGWFPEFAKDKINSFVVPPSDIGLPEYLQDDIDCISLYDLLEKDILPMYYDFNSRWMEIICNSMKDIQPYFDSKRMADEYYVKMYQ